MNVCVCMSVCVCVCVCVWACACLCVRACLCAFSFLFASVRIHKSEAVESVCAPHRNTYIHQLISAQPALMPRPRPKSMSPFCTSCSDRGQSQCLRCQNSICTAATAAKINLSERIASPRCRTCLLGAMRLWPGDQYWLRRGSPRQRGGGARCRAGLGPGLALQLILGLVELQLAIFPSFFEMLVDLASP